MNSRISPVFRQSSLAIFAAISLLFFALGAAKAQTAPASDNQIVQRGEYLVRAGDCVSCHTAPGGKPLAGGLYMPTPFGQISTPNITPDKATGIGDWSDDEFYRAMHDGIGKHNEYLYPVFPFPWFTNVSKADVLAIKAYLFAQAPQNAPRQPLKLAFPFDIRESLVAWRAAFFKPGQSDDQSDRGKYLVEGLGHCGECHNRHAVFGASDWSGKLKGGEIEGWYAPNLTSAGADSIQSWSDAQLVGFLKNGAAPGKGVALGPMRETIDNSLHYLTDDDLGAIATYIKTATAGEAASTPSQSGTAPTLTGAQVYLSNCAFCHQPDGKGVSGKIPGLAGNPAVTAQGPENVIRVVLGGLDASHGLAPMPAVGVGLSDPDIAAVVNYVRTAWGNTAPANAEGDAVHDLRQKTHTMLAANLSEGCNETKDPNLAKVVDSVSDKLRGTDMATMQATIAAIVPAVEGKGAKDDDIVNALTAAYCRQLTTDTSVQPAQRAELLGYFGSLVYGQLETSQQSKTAPAKASGGG